MSDVVERAEDCLIEFDRQPRRYIGARGLMRELIAELKATRAQLAVAQDELDTHRWNTRNLLNDGHGPGKDVGERAEGSSGAEPAKSPTSPSPTSARAPVAHSPSPEDAPEAPRAVVQPHSGEVRPGHPNAEIQNMEDIWDSTVFAAEAFSKAGARAVRTRPRMTTIAAACRDIDTLRERSRHPDRLYRWQIFQSRLGAWCVLPPLYPVAGGDAPRWFPTFEAARAAFAAGKETRAGA